ncbi:YtxH domain-containing protein [Mucilaginibacter sp.]|nr:YtxH domain-containing protein [Mucilaginibacter sp.]MDR3696862.1 YtxH domain-containing protein [Mucilaginibacter sp.]
MHLLKYIIVGAAVGYGINYITKKGANGRSIIEDLADNVPNWFD